MEVDEDGCITISDDEDVCVLKHVINLEPIIVDLSDSESSENENSSPRDNVFDEQSQSHRPAPSSPFSQTQKQSQEQSHTFSQPRTQSQTQPEPPPQSQARPQTKFHATSTTPSPQYRWPPFYFPRPPTHYQYMPSQHPRPPFQFHRPPSYHQRPQSQFHRPPFQHQRQPFHDPQSPSEQEPPPPSRDQQSQPPAERPPSRDQNAASQDTSSISQEQQPPSQNPQPSQQDPIPPSQDQNLSLQNQSPQTVGEPQEQQIVANENQINVTQPPPTDSELLIAKKNLGNEKYKKNLFSEAIRIYKEASELAKKLGDTDMSATIHFNLAMAYDKLGSFNQAADECALAVRLKDDYMKPHLKRAEIYERLRKFHEAVICWEHICELDSNNREYAIRLGRVREAAKRLHKRCYYELLGINPLNFTREDLKKAYKKKALTHHPDRHPDADIVTKRIQEKLFKDASEAHSSIQLRFGYNR